jgi:ABC-type nitrate/sulfonate/bicarbonate transport system permease component
MWREGRAWAGAPLVSVGGFLALWWLLTSVLGLGDETTAASPLEVLATLGALAVEPFAGHTLGGHVAASLWRWTLGVGAGVAVGVPLGVLMAWSEEVDAAVGPAFDMLRNIPPLAWIPLAIVWFGTDTTSQALLVFVGALPPSLLNAYRAIKGIDPRLLAAARTVGARPWHQLVEVALPTGLPAILAGMRIAFGNGWMALVGAELVGAPSGLGFLIVRGQENLTPAVIIAGMVVIGIMGLALDAALRVATRPLLRWRREATAEA